MWNTQSSNLKVVDKFNNLSVSAYITPSSCKFLLLHFDLNEDNVKTFFQSVHSLFIKLLLNPFYEPNLPISDLKFDLHVRTFGEKVIK